MMLRLFWKFTLAIIAIVAIFGSINLYFINFSVYHLFEDELNRHGIITATSIAERSIDPIVYDDLAALNKLVSDQKRIDSSVAYVFVINEKEQVLAHTFDENVPTDLIRCNIPDDAKTPSTLRLLDQTNPDREIRDIAVPILDGNLGFVRMGLFEENYTRSMRLTSNIFLIMVFVFLIIGIVGALFFSHIITKPIKTISQIAEKINIDNLGNLNDDHISQKLDHNLIKWKNLLNTTDEIDVLIDQFQNMVERLRHTYTELQQVQSNLLQSEKMASLGTLSAGLAHEINNPITGMQNCLRRISESPENIKQNILYIDMMVEAVNKIEKVVGNLLNFSRKQEMVFDQLSLVSVLENVLLLASYQLEKYRISLNKELDHSYAIILASKNHIEQVVLNLLLNSIEAIEEKKMQDQGHVGEIQFKLFSDGHSVVFRISDNGIGVNEANLKTIFDPFFTQKKVRQGTGLGLAVCYNIIKQHNATIEASNNEKGGLTMTIKFPKIIEA
jgi:two-component system NtrC family sensor kinase